MSTIEERVKKIVVEQLGVKEEEVVTTASFVDDTGADSLDTVELVMALEEEFECEIPDEEAEKISTVQLRSTTSRLTSRRDVGRLARGSGAYRHRVQQTMGPRLRPVLSVTPRQPALPGQENLQ